MINETLKAADLLSRDGIEAEVIKINRLDKFDVQILLDSAERTGRVVVLEDCVCAGSLGEYIASEIAGSDVNATVELLNFCESFSEVGTTPQNYRLHGLDANGVYSSVMSANNNKNREGI